MLCTQCQELVSDYIDGALELGEQVQVERHLADCEPCRAVRDDLLQIIHFSRQLPLQAPSGAVWARIQAEIGNEKVPFWSRAARWWTATRDHPLRLTIPQLTASAAVLSLVVSIGVMLARRDQGPSPDTVMGAGAPAINRLSNPEIQDIEKRIDQLRQTVEERKIAWNPELRVAFERNMIYVDQSLVECRHELIDNPGDDVSQELMLNAYREKMRLLEGFSKF